MVDGSPGASSVDYVATCALGTERALAGELQRLGMRDVQASHGSVAFVGGEDDGMRACLWSRTALRVLLPLVHKKTPDLDADGLYDVVRAISWQDHLAPRRTFAVEATGATPALRHTGFIALRAKDAIVDAVKAHRGERPDVDAKHPDVPIAIHVGPRSVSVSLDLGGGSLHRRGYRPPGAEAPMKETLAASLLLFTGYRGDQAFCDPLAGTGTLAIEAAWIAQGRAPGLGRRFAFERAPDFLGARQGRWHRMQQEARDAIKTRGLPPILARELFAEPMKLLRQSVELAGVTEVVRVEKGDVRTLELEGDIGTVVMNPPYAERLGKPLQILGLYRAMGEAAARWHGWNVHVLSGNPGFEKAFGHTPVKRREVFNGPVACQFLSYRVPRKG
jgi:23S rRNA (guanine2445-N2)-methyltransferase / 23S rRNA (guanine2069-N7)-methyltransferase